MLINIENIEVSSYRTTTHKKTVDETHLKIII
jgi:hypothetical protein